MDIQIHDYDSLAPTAHKFRVDGNVYTLNEPTEEQADRFKELGLKYLIFQKGEIAGFKTGYTTLEPKLVAWCLGDSEGNDVTEETVARWPSRVVKDLFQRVKKMGAISVGPDTTRHGLYKALSQDSAPVSLEDLRKYVNNLEGDEFNDLREFLEPTEEELAKN